MAPSGRNRDARKPILALGAYLRDDRVQHASFKSSVTLLQHEIVIWDPEEILDGYPTGKQYNNAPCLSDAGSVAFRHDLERREHEIKEFLQLGRLLVILVPKPDRWYIATGRNRNDGTAAKPRITRLVEEVTASEVLPVGLDLVRATGHEFRLAAGPPFATFWRAVGYQFYFSAYLRTAVGSTLLTMAGAEHSVAALIQEGRSTTLLLPQVGSIGVEDEQVGVDPDDEKFDELWDEAQRRLDQEHHGKLVDGLLDLHAELILSPDEVLPAWTDDYLLPGEQIAVTELTSAEERAAQARRDVESAEAGLLQLRKRKVLITGTGKPLEKAVEDALVALGCAVEPGYPDRTDRIVHWGGKTAVVEIKGLTKSARESDAAQLEKWVSEYLAEHDEAPKAILAVDAWRAVPLNDRTELAFPDQMLKYCKQREHCLVETSQVLTATLTCKTKNAKNQFLTLLFETVGRLSGYTWDTALTPTMVETAP